MAIDGAKFHEIVSDHLAPLFSGAQLEFEVQGSTTRAPTVAWDGPLRLLLKPRKTDTFSVVLTRSQPFALVSSDFVTEYKVCSAFVGVLEELRDGIDTAMEPDLLAHFTRRVAVRAVCNHHAQEAAVLGTIDQLDVWSSKLHEGQPIAAAIGFSEGQHACQVRLVETWPQDFGEVLTNALDTMIVSSFDGWVQEYRCLEKPDLVPGFAPHRLAPVAGWTESQAGRIAVVLNRTGEILLLRDGQLVFARRSGKWHFLTHEPVVTQMLAPHDKKLRREVYASCLDASFARTGACVGILTSNNTRKLQRIAPKPDDHVQESNSVKARAIRQAINGKRFQDLDRRLRQELLAIDGATILDYTGRILAVGAILHIQGGSTGGGRLAAAIAMSKYGVGIKVSQDGGITGFHRCDDPENAVPSFTVM